MGEGKALRRNPEGLSLVLRYPGDIEKFDHSMKLRIVEELLAVRLDPEKGTLLGEPRVPNMFLGDMSPWGVRAWSVRLWDEGNNYYNEARIVYRVDGKSIDVIAIGPRMGSQAYMLAWKRLEAEHKSDRPKPRRFRPFR